MSKERKRPIIEREKLDHPEHYYDLIREYEGEDRHYPNPLEDLLLEQCGHRCTICSAPYCEIHHIKHLKSGGKTEYTNLIVLCPNCHTRVHRENIPTPTQLKHYKLKLEVGYKLPIIQRLTKKEKDFILDRSKENDSRDLLLFRQRFRDCFITKDPLEGQRKLRDQIGLFELEEAEIITTEHESCIGLLNGEFDVSILLRLTPKGITWIKYLKETKRLQILE